MAALAIVARVDKLLAQRAAFVQQKVACNQSPQPAQAAQFLRKLVAELSHVQVLALNGYLGTRLLEIMLVDDSFRSDCSVQFKSEASRGTTA